MILITGANGFVGHRLMETVTDAIAAPSLRNATQEDIKRFIEESGADTIIHTAAISDIGVCQSDPEASYLANVRLPLWIAQASAGRKLICFSSDQVYSGSDEDGPYTEEMVAPGNVYAAHKLEMEQRVLDCLPDAVILRAEWMYDIRSPRPNYNQIRNCQNRVLAEPFMLHNMSPDLFYIKLMKGKLTCPCIIEAASFRGISISNEP